MNKKKNINGIQARAKINLVLLSTKINNVYKNIRSFSSKSILNENNVVSIASRKKLFSEKILSYDNFNLDSFIQFMMENLHINSSYTILVKLGLNSNRLFFMLGNQIGVCISGSHNIAYYENIFDVILLQIDDILSKYDIDMEPDSITISYKAINIPVSLINSNIKSLSLNKSVFKQLELRKIFSSNYLPLTMDNSHFGFLIEDKYKSNYINKVIKNISTSGLSVPEILTNSTLIKNSNIFIRKVPLNRKKLDQLIIDVSLQDYVSYFLNVNVNIPNVKINNNISTINNLIKSNHLNDDGFVRVVFDINTGICMFVGLDVKIDTDTFIRKLPNVSLILKNNKVIEISRSVKLDNIKPFKFKNSSMSNNNIGVLDVETFVNCQGLGQVYCLGYATLNDRDRINTFYLSDLAPSLNSDLLIINCINSMLEPKYQNYYWYIHNMGKFDIVYIYKTLEEFNLKYKKEYYKLVTTYKENKMLRLVIKRKTNSNKYIKITLLDSYNFLPSSLDTLTKDFNVLHLKGKFPYSFVNGNNLNFVGETPSIDHFKNISISEYNYIYTKTNWSLKDETIKYLKHDILGLLEVLEKFKTYLFIEHNLELTEGLTISRLALNKFLKNNLKDSKIPLINKFNLFNFIYLGYFGGRTEVFKPYGENLYYYDVNSLYPQASLNNMPGLKASYIKSFTAEGLNLDNLFGVFKAKVKTNNKYLGLLPVKTKLGLIFPIGEFDGIWSTPELKFAKENGYDIKVIEGYNFDEGQSYFKKYVLDLFVLKAKTKGSERSVNKSLLNNLLGRFGLNIIKPVSKIVNSKTLDYLLSTRKIKSIEEINEETILVNYIPIIDSQICMEHGLDYTKVINEKNNSNLEKNIDVFEDVSIIVSALVNSYARVLMLKTMIEIYKAGGNIYYTDTDSLVTDIPLEKINTDLVGSGLGQFKFENLIKEAYFISNKTYCLVLCDGSTIIKCKGVKNDSLTLDDFKLMYFSSKDVYATKTTSTTDLSKGSVVIEDKKILLKHDVYTKRKKTYNEQGLWINTEPLLYNNLEKGIITI